jgi:hypothetical protein
MAYGLVTYKSNGTTVVLQNSTPSAVYAKAVTLDNSGTGATRSEPIPTRPAYSYYYLDFPEYTGRTIRPIQLRPGLHDWITGVGTGSLAGVPYIRWDKNVYQVADYGVSTPEFYYDTTVLYIFVR